MPKALVIDDSRAIRKILKQMLGQLGFDACEAGDGKEALAVLQKEGPGVSFCLVDWNMPEMNGYDFVLAVRKDSTYDNVRIMMVTTESEISYVVKALEAGANEYVMKPFTKEVIQEKLAIMGIGVN